MTVFNKSDYITELSGYVKLNKTVSISISLLLFSTAGVPPLAGFITKFLVISEALKNDYYVSALIAVLSSTIALIYYIRMRVCLYIKYISFGHV